MLDRANSRRLRSFLPPLLLQLKLPLLLLIMFFFFISYSFYKNPMRTLACVTERSNTIQRVTRVIHRFVYSVQLCFFPPPVSCIISSGSWPLVFTILSVLFMHHQPTLNATFPHFGI